MSENTPVLCRDVEYASVPEAARLFGVSQPTVYRLIREAGVRAVKLGRATRVDVQSMRAHFAGLPKLN